MRELVEKIFLENYLEKVFIEKNFWRKILKNWLKKIFLEKFSQISFSENFRRIA